MDSSTLTILIIVLVTILALKVKAIRKATGLLLIILGIIFTLSFLGAIIGVPMIFVGGILLFMGK